MLKPPLDVREIVPFGCLLVALSICATVSARTDLPNIVFIMADDLGYGDLGCYGSKRIKTPNIDRLADAGMKFSDCYAGSPVCAPSRCVLMTGLHTGHTTVRGNFGVGGVVGLAGNPGRVPLRDDDVTLAELLKSAGYTTCMTGKWGLGEPNTTGEPMQQGFDQWFGYLNQRRAHSYYPTYLWHGRHQFDLPGNSDGRKQQYSHDLFTGFALNFIRKQADEPFFLYLPYTIPHNRFEVPDLGPYEKEDWPTEAKTYAAMITRMDKDIGRIATLLEELKLAEKTVVFFCSDNGAANRYEGLFDSSGRLRGKKRDLYEGGIRTPMIACWPGQIPANSTSDLPWYFADVVPTVAEIAQIPIAHPIDGSSILPTLLGQTQDFSTRFLYWEFFEAGYQQAARCGHWKCLRLREDAPVELYNLAHDPGETSNVAAENAAIAQQFESIFSLAHTESAAFPRKYIQSP